MKNYYITILLVAFINHFTFAQIPVSELKHLKNAAQFKEGEEVLLKLFAKSTRPTREMVSNPEVCTVLGLIKVKRDGTIADIGILNKVPKPFKNTFIQVAKLTDGQWLPSNDTSESFYAVMPIQFKVTGTEYELSLENMPKYFHEPLVVVSYLPNNSSLNFKDDSKYLKRIEEFVVKGKNDKAIETIKYLLSRQPFNLDYYRKAIDLYKKAGKKDEVEYYTTLMEVLSDKS